MDIHNLKLFLLKIIYSVTFPAQSNVFLRLMYNRRNSIKKQCFVDYGS